LPSLLNLFDPKPVESMQTLSKHFLSFLVILIILTACGKKVDALPAVSATPDPCVPANIAVEVKKVNDLQRQFDDASQLASVLNLNQLASSNAIPNMQEIRRQAQDQQVPACLATLKTLQLQHMNAVINTLLAFLASGQNASNNSQVLSQGIALARSLHDKYNQELARLIGATYVPPITATPNAPQAAKASGTPAGTTSPAILPDNTPAGAYVTSAGTGPVNIRAKPAPDARSLVWMDAGKSIQAIGKTADGTWIQVSDPYGNMGWVAAADVKLTVGANLPVVTPTP
jgi:hypothetical protein